MARVRPTLSAHISILDSEDRSGGFDRGGWTVPHFDSETATFVDQVYQRADAFLLGRRTY